MKGFLKIFLIILVLGVIAVLAIGGVCCYTYNNIKETAKVQFQEDNPIVIEQKAKAIVNYTLPENYSLLKSFDLYGLNAAIFMYIPTNQFLVTCSPEGIAKMFLKFDETNFKQELTPEKIQQALKQNQSQNVEIKEYKIISEGMLPTSTREIPYIMGNAILEKRTTGDIFEIEGMISVFTTSEKKNVIIVSGNKLGKFDFNATKEFIKTLEVK